MGKLKGTKALARIVDRLDGLLTHLLLREDLRSPAGHERSLTGARQSWADLAPNLPIDPLVESLGQALDAGNLSMAVVYARNLLLALRFRERNPTWQPAWEDKP